eukprot:Nitzschia sp. Nitz4//scaffold10_size219509//125874//126377//NITZ4_001435-RA/size219509-augustus-gene-0.248-mRNA-1//1//CDS//3329532941//6477//frame0
MMRASPKRQTDLPRSSCSASCANCNYSTSTPHTHCFNYQLATLFTMFVTKASYLGSRVSSVASRRFLATASKPSTGAGLFGRISSFFVGAGVTALVTQFYLYQELLNGNKLMLEKQKDLEARLAKLEK